MVLPLFMGKGGEPMDPIVIGQRLRKLRGKKSMSEVAKAIGVTASAIGNYEQGTRCAKDEIKVKLANYYGVSVTSIFFD